MADPISTEIAIVGAGAAGLWAAARAAGTVAPSGERRDVLLIEKTPRAGTKILASGGTHCNLTTTLGTQEAAQLFGVKAARFLTPAFRAVTPENVREHFAGLGVPTVKAPLEKIFPESGRARDVRDALEHDAREKGVRFLFEAPVESIEPVNDGWLVRLSGDREVTCKKLLLCPGGKSYSGSGTTGDGYKWLASLDLTITPTVPALVPLSSDAVWVHELAGVSVQAGEVRLVLESGKVVARRTRPILFTHEGLSGPGAMDVSVHIARAQAEGGGQRYSVAIDLLPSVTREELRERFVAAASDRGAPKLLRVLPERPSRRILGAACAQAGIEDANPSLNGLDKKTRHALVEALKGLTVPIDGTLGFDKAEVTAGGLALSEVDRSTMRVKRFEGLYAFGEILDLDGPIGGLNFQAAFATAELAARDAVR